MDKPGAEGMAGSPAAGASSDAGGAFARPARARLLAIGAGGTASRVLGSLEARCEVVSVPTAAAAAPVLKLDGFQAVLVDAGAPDFSAAALESARITAWGVPCAVFGEDPEAEAVLQAAETASFLFLDLREPVAALTARLGALLEPRAEARAVAAVADAVASGRIGGLAFRHPVADLSNRGLAFRVPAGEATDVFLPGREIRDLVVEGARGERVLELPRAVVRHCRPDGDGRLRVGVELEAHSAPAPRQRTVTEAPQVLASLRKACESGEVFEVALPDSDRRWQAAARALTEDGRPRLELDAAAPELAAHDVVRLSFQLHGQSYAGLASVVCGEGRLRLAAPRALRVQHRRASRRHRPAPGRRYDVWLCSPLAGLDWRGPAADLGASGLSVLVDPARDVLPPGLQLPLVRVVLPDEGVIETRGVVRSLARAAPGAVGGRVRCGVELLGLSAADRLRLAESALTDGYPSVEVAGPQDFPKVWDFLAEAGFRFHLYGDGSQRSRDIAAGGWGRLLRQGRELGCSVLYRRGGAIQGHMSALRYHTRAWLVTHLAAHQAGGAEAERASRALTLGMASHLEGQSPCDFIRFVWRRDHRWVNHMFLRACLAVHSPGSTEKFDFTHLVRPAQVLPAPDGPVRVREGGPEDGARAARHLAATRSHLRVQAEDLGPEGLRLGELGRDYARAGLERSRRLRVAEVDGRPAGFALLEEATAGLQLSELTNSFEIFVLPGGDPQTDREVRRALAVDATSRIAERGLGHAVALTEEADPGPWLAAGFEVAALSRCWIMQRGMLRGWSDAFDQMFRRGREAAVRRGGGSS